MFCLFQLCVTLAFSWHEYREGLPLYSYRRSCSVFLPSACSPLPPFFFFLIFGQGRCRFRELEFFFFFCIRLFLMKKEIVHNDIKLRYTMLNFKVCYANASVLSWRRLVTKLREATKPACLESLHLSSMIGGSSPREQESGYDVPRSLSPLPPR